MVTSRKGLKTIIVWITVMHTNTNTNKKIVIIQTSPQHTASTLLVNALHGIIEEVKDRPIRCIWDHDKFDYMQSHGTNITVVKAHDIDIDKLIRLYSNEYELFFVCSVREEKGLILDKKYASYGNVAIFQYEELNEMPENTIPMIIDRIYNRLDTWLSSRNYTPIRLNKATGIERVMHMNKVYDEIKDKPFTYIDPFFSIHGSHRGRIS